ncbi:hypothetical protein, partial [Serratia marcescens]|uniref:hypothetical protein n=1 Tax=Serratia marcescens TaxID=615 RepID=UPI001953E009
HLLEHIANTVSSSLGQAAAHPFPLGFDHLSLSLPLGLHSAPPPVRCSSLLQLTDMVSYPEFTLVTVLTLLPLQVPD